MHLMLNKTVLWQLFLLAIRMFSPQLKLGKIKWIPRDPFVFWVHIWGIFVACVPFGVKVLGPWSSSRLGGKIWPFRGRLWWEWKADTRHEGRGQQVALPWDGKPEGFFYSPQGQFPGIQHCHKAQSGKWSWGMEGVEAGLEWTWPRSVHDVWGGLLDY